jgi:hypothetical protein
MRFTSRTIAYYFTVRRYGLLKQDEGTPKGTGVQRRDTRVLKWRNSEFAGGWTLNASQPPGLAFSRTSGCCNVANSDSSSQWCWMRYEVTGEWQKLTNGRGVLRCAGRAWGWAAGRHERWMSRVSYLCDRTGWGCSCSIPMGSTSGRFGYRRHPRIADGAMRTARRFMSRRRPGCIASGR